MMEIMENGLDLKWTILEWLTDSQEAFSPRRLQQYVVRLTIS